MLVMVVLGRLVLFVVRAEECLDVGEGDEPAVIEDGDAVGERLGLVDEVSGEEDGGAFITECAHVLEDVSSCVWIDAGGRFIEYEQRRSVDGGDGELEASLHALGPVSDAFVGAMVEMESFELGDNVRVRDAVEAGEESEMFARGEVVVEPELLRRESEGLPGVVMCWVAFVDSDVSGVWSESSGSECDGGGFAGTVWPEERNHFSRLDRE